MSINLRLDEDMHAELTRIAEEEDRSLAAQIRRYLRLAIEQHRAAHPASEREAGDDR